MIDKFTDEQLIEMGIAKYHIRQWHRQETVRKGVERTKRNAKILWGERHNNKYWEDIYNKILDNYDEVMVFKGNELY